MSSSNNGGKMNTSVIYKGRKFTAGVNDTGGHIFPEIHLMTVTMQQICYQCERL